MLFIKNITICEIFISKLIFSNPTEIYIISLTGGGNAFSRTPDREIPRDRQCEILRSHTACLTLLEVFGATLHIANYNALLWRHDHDHVTSQAV